MSGNTVSQVSFVFCRGKHFGPRSVNPKSVSTNQQTLQSCRFPNETISTKILDSTTMLVKCTLKWVWCWMSHWAPPYCFFWGSRPGREPRIPRAVLAGEGGLLVGYGGCGRPGLGLGCAESLPGVPRLYGSSRGFSGVITISVYQKRYCGLQ